MITVKEGLEIIEHVLEKPLTKLQELVFRQAWKEQSYKEIARATSRDVGHIKNVGSELWQMLSEALGERVTKQNFQIVLQRHWIKRQETGEPEKGGAGATGPNHPSSSVSSSFSSPGSSPHQDWEEAIDISVFADRLTELELLYHWVVDDRCHLILLLGMGGIGKTALAVRLAQQTVAARNPGLKQSNFSLQSGSESTFSIADPPFNFIIWRSLREAPPIDQLLTDLIKVLSNQQETELSNDVTDKITRLIHYLSASRCLLVLDNVEPLLHLGDRAGQFREGYEGYEELFRRVAQSSHESCIILTSRETPKIINQLVGKTRPVRMMQLRGLSLAGGQAIFAEYGTFRGTVDEWQSIVNHYAGNPLALKIAASRIQEVLDGDISRFIEEYLEAGQVAFADIHDLFDRQFQCLSASERDVMYWLTINREPVPAEELREDVVSPISKQKVLDVVASLKQRSFIEKTTNGFIQQPVVMEYITERLVETITEEIIEWKLEDKEIPKKTTLSASSSVSPGPHALPATPFLQTYALIKAQSKDYVREAQTRLILEPIAQQLLTHFGGKLNLEHRLRQILASLQHHAPQQPGYAAGNLLNLLCYLQVDLAGYDFSNLAVWQAYLSSVTLPQVNFAHADLSKSVFAESFGGILSVVFSPNGQQLAIADTNGGLRLWDVQTGRSVMTLKAHEVWIWSIAYSPTDPILASASDDHTVKLWDLNTGGCLRTLRGHAHSVLAVAFSANGEWLATGSDDLTIRLWNIKDFGKNDRSWQAHDRRVWSLVFSPDGQTLASSSEDQTIKFWDVATEECIQTLEGHSDWVKGIAFSPTEPVFASSSHDQTIKLWNRCTGECLKTLIGHANAVTAVAFSPDGQQLVSCSHDQTVRVWDVHTGQCLRVLQEHTNRLWSLAFSAMRQQPIHPEGLAGLVASGGDDHMVKLWNLRSGQCIKTFRGHTNAILMIALNADRVTLASGHEDETVKLWDLQTGRVFRTLRGHSDRVWSVAFAPPHIREPLLVSGSGDHTVKLWNWQTGECLKTLHGHTSWVWSVVFHPMQRQFASGSYDGTINLWALPDGECLQTLKGHTASVTRIMFSPDGEWLASCGFDKTIRLWNVASGECDRVLQGHTNTVWQMTFSPNGQHLASGSYDHTLKLWDRQTGDCLQTFEGHAAPIVTVVFAENGQRLISGSFDQTIKVWNLETGECLDTLETPRPYEEMNILGTKGLTVAQKITLQLLGAIEVSEPKPTPVAKHRGNRRFRRFALG